MYRPITPIIPNIPATSARCGSRGWSPTRGALYFGLVAFLAACTGAQATRTVDRTQVPGDDDAREPMRRATSSQPADNADLRPPALRLPAHVVPTRYAVELAIDPDQPLFDGVVTIDLEIREETHVLWLNATDLAISSALLRRGARDTPLALVFEQDPDVAGFKIAGKQAKENKGEAGSAAPDDEARVFSVGPARLRIEYRGKLGDQRDGGMFRVRTDEQWYAYSHFEPLDARQAIPSFDEPQHKVPWQLSIDVKNGHQAFTNTPLVDTRPAARSGFTRYRFAESKPLPSYLVAVAVGPFDVVDIGRIGRAQTPARVIVPRGRASQAAHAVRTIPAVLDWFEDYFDMAYPFAKLDSVAIPEQGGAMEHPGLITYGERILLTEEKDRDSRFESYHFMVVAHELAHQWFGNLVTLAWWNDLWLNESFATWMASKARRDSHPEWQSDLEELNRLEWTKTVDARASARRLRRRITSNEDIEGTFDTISYGKGGAVLTMFEEWIGAPAFREGVRDYIRTHAWGTTTAEDFLAALARASKPEIATAFQSFLDQPGLPNVAVELVCETSGPATVFLRQSRFAGDPASAQGFVWGIPVCVRYGLEDLDHKACTLMTGGLATMVLDQEPSCPGRFVANANASGYYRVAYSKPLRDALLGQDFDRMSSLEQLATINDIQAQVDDGSLSIGEVLPLIARLASHRAPYVVSRAVTLAASIRYDWVPASLRDEHTRFISRTFGQRARKLGWTARRGDDTTVHELRRALVGMVADLGADAKLRREARRLAIAWLDDNGDIHQDMFASVLTVALRGADDALYARFESALDKDMERSQTFALLTAITSTASEERLRRYWTELLDGKRDWRYAWFLLGVAMNRPEVQDAAYEFLTQNFDKLAERLPRRLRGALFALFARVCDDKRYREVQAFMAARANATKGHEEATKDTLDTIERCVRARASQQPEIERFLREWRPGKRR